MAPAGFHMTIQQVNGADLFTEVYCTARVTPCSARS